MSDPLLGDVGVIALVPEPWGPQWQVRHHVLSRLARYFRVLWVNPARGWGGPAQALKRDRADAADLPPPTGLTVYTPEFWLPQVYRSALLARLSLRGRMHRAREQLLARGARRIVLYLWRPDFAPALAVARYNLSCYHIDDEYSFSPVDVPTSETERALIARADQVFIHSPGLLEKKGRINPHTDWAPLGVDYDRFAAPQPEPDDLASVPRPRIGYVGVLKKTLDWRLLRFLSERRPDCSLVLMGARASHREIEAPIRELSQRPNVTFLPPRPTLDVPPYVAHLDVGILPYVADDYSKYGYPLKLHEYLAAGRPVVGTRMRTLEDFTNVIRLASTEEEWLEGITRSLEPSARDAAHVEARRAVARRYDWGVLVERIAARIADRLGGDVASRYAELVGARTTPPLVSSTSATPPP